MKVIVATTLAQMALAITVDKSTNQPGTMAGDSPDQHAAPGPYKEGDSDSNGAPGHYTVEDGSGGPEYTVEDGSGGPHYTVEDGSGGPHYTVEDGSGGPDYTNEDGSGGPHYTVEDGSGGPHYTNEDGSGGPDAADAEYPELDPCANPDEDLENPDWHCCVHGCHIHMDEVDYDQMSQDELETMNAKEGACYQKCDTDYPWQTEETEEEFHNHEQVREIMQVYSDCMQKEGDDNVCGEAAEAEAVARGLDHLKEAMDESELECMFKTLEGGICHSCDDDISKLDCHHEIDYCIRDHLRNDEDMEGSDTGNTMDGTEGGSDECLDDMGNTVACGSDMDGMEGGSDTGLTKDDKKAARKAEKKAKRDDRKAKRAAKKAAKAAEATGNYGPSDCDNCWYECHEQENDDATCEQNCRDDCQENGDDIFDHHDMEATETAGTYGGETGTADANMTGTEQHMG